MTRRSEPAGISLRRKDMVSAPLLETLSRVAAMGLGGVEAVRTGDTGPGWVTSAELAGNGPDNDLVEDLLRRVGGVYGSDDRAALGSLFLRGYLWRLLVPTVSAFLIERRVPDPGGENVALSFDEGGAAAGLVFVSGRFAALPDDPDAAHPDAQVFPSEDEMLGYLRDRLSAGLPDLFSALRRARTRRGARVLWGMAADVCVEAFVHAGRALGCEDEAHAGAARMLGGPSPLSGPTDYFVLEYEGTSRQTRVRNSCCLYYKIGEGPCFTCPRLSNEDRLRRMKEDR